MLTSEQAEDLERLQGQSLKIIFGFENSYRKVMELAGVDSLEERRDRALLKFAKKSFGGNFPHWFPLNQCTRGTRNRLRYREDYARCDQLRNSPVYSMRRLLNAEEE
jgi:hypothetical protein